MTHLRRFLGRHRRIALDTSVFIYQLEANTRYSGLTDAVFRWLEQDLHSAVTSTIVMSELLVQPYRKGDRQLVDLFYGLLSTFSNLEWVSPNLEVADLAARIRARHGLRMPDALVAATALKANATGLVTNDRFFARIDGLDALVLDQLL